MSAFIVTDKCIHAIVTMLINAPIFARSLTDRGIRIEPTALCTALYKMNVDAVNARYPNHPQEALEKLRFVSYHVNASQQAKYLSCFIYQCSEGSVPECALYKALEEVENTIEAITPEGFKNSKDYQTAEWG